MNKLYFRFIRFSLGIEEGKKFLDGSALKNFDWQAFYEFAGQQTLLGIIMDGVQRLPREVAPKQELLMRWFFVSQKLAKQNVILDKATTAIYHKIVSEGYQCCILKGQGNAVLYPNPAARTPGDVDVWVNASREEIRQLAQRLADNMGKVEEESLNHVVVTIKGISVELHSTPAIMCNPLHHHRLQKWLRANVEEQCSHIVPLASGVSDRVCEAAIPTASFNVVYQLYHLYHHYLYEGIGLRQFLDYYMQVKSEERRVKKQSLVPEGKANLNDAMLQKTLQQLGLWNFAGAVMYVLHEVMGLSEAQMIAPMDEKRGKMLLDEILQGGNFGHHAENRSGALTWRHNIYRLQKDWELMWYYPGECMVEPFYRLWHFFWRMKHRQ